MASLVEATHLCPALASSARRESTPDRRKTQETAPVSQIPARPVSRIPLENLMNPGLFAREGLESDEFRSPDSFDLDFSWFPDMALSMIQRVR